ncbi:zinc ABC transporter substrate-binding protein [Candidatus Falkowbacteria bacterium]|nr:zinc ABC transporter substrate-binding protein [Candidatus Falkowbacteria bacterium]
MQKHMKSIVVGVILLVVIGLGVDVFKNKNQDQVGEQIMVTLPVFADVVLRLSDHQIAPTVLITPGQSEHSFTLTPSQLKATHNAPVVLYVGLGLDDWIVKELADAKPSITAVSLEKNITLRKDEHDHGDFDPHYWLSFENATIITDSIANTLIAHYPTLDKQRIIDNANAFKEELRLAFNQYKTTVLPKLTADQKNIVTYHEAWGYLASEIGFTVVGTVQEFAGKEPTARYIAELLRTISSQNIKKIFIEPQLATESVQFMLQDLGVEIRVLDPLGGVQGRMTYLDLLTYNLSELVK